MLEAAQHGDLVTGRFFLRIEIVAESLPAGFGPEELAAAFPSRWRPEFSMDWTLHDTNAPKRVVLFASKEDALRALTSLYRWRSGELESARSPCVISNHDDLRGLVEWHGVRFRYVPVGSEPSAQRRPSRKWSRSWRRNRPK